MADAATALGKLACFFASPRMDDLVLTSEVQNHSKPNSKVACMTLIEVTGNLTHGGQQSHLLKPCKSKVSLSPHSRVELWRLLHGAAVGRSEEHTSELQSRGL